MIIKQTLAGKSLPRILMNRAIELYTKKHPLKGKVIDLGSKSDKMSYNRYLQKEENCSITYTDFAPISKGVEKVDLEKPFPIEENSYDTVLCLNTLEHIYNGKNIVSESARILKKDGKFIGAIPFLVPFHPDPNDYFRYTHQAIEKMMIDAGFEKLEMKKLGVGPFSTGLYQLVMLMPKFLRPLCLLKLIAMDKILNFFTKNRHDGKKYTLMHFFVFKKL